MSFTRQIVGYGLMAILSSCYPVTEQESEERWGDGLNTFPLFCTAYATRQDCSLWAADPKWTSEAECRDSERVMALMCLYEAQEHQRIEGLSDVPFSGGACLFNC